MGVGVVVIDIDGHNPGACLRVPCPPPGGRGDFAWGIDLLQCPIRLVGGTCGIGPVFGVAPLAMGGTSGGFSGTVHVWHLFDSLQFRWVGMVDSSSGIMAFL